MKNSQSGFSCPQVPVFLTTPRKAESILKSHTNLQLTDPTWQLPACPFLTLGFETPSVPHEGLAVRVQGGDWVTVSLSEPKSPTFLYL